MRANTHTYLNPSIAPAKPMDDGDERLLRGIANGDRRCIHGLMERHKNRLLGIAFAVLHSREDAEDTLQEVMAQVWRKAAFFDPSRGSVTTWLTTMIRNRSIDRLRLRQRQSRLAEAYQAYAEDVGDQGLVDGKADHELQLRDECVTVRHAILQLGPDQQQAIQLAFFEGLTQQEIAQRLETPLGTIKARIRRGLQKLNRLVSPQLSRN